MTEAIQDKMNLLVELNSVSLGRSHKSAINGITDVLQIIDNYRKSDKHGVTGCIAHIHIDDMRDEKLAFEAKTPNVHGKFQDVLEEATYTLNCIKIEVQNSISDDLGDWLQESLWGSTLCVVRFDKTTRKISVVSTLSLQRSWGAIVRLLEKGVKHIMEDREKQLDAAIAEAETMNTQNHA